MWKKIQSILSLKKNQNKSNENQTSLHFLTDDNDPDDMVFVKKFNAAGGNFIYCEDQKEFLFSINSILLENNISELICFDASIKKKLDQANIQYKIELRGNSIKSTFLLMPCEYLIAFDGSIMVSSDQTKKYKTMIIEFFLEKPIDSGFDDPLFYFLHEYIIHKRYRTHTAHAACI